MGWFDKGIKGALEGIGSIIDDVTTTKEEKAQAILSQFEAEVKDRDSARDMYKDDSSLQKWFALVFLVSYMALTCAMLYFIYLIAFGQTGVDINLPDWAVAFLSTLFGAMSAKVSTITDFLFGGSKSNTVDRKQK
ncbi:MAG: hypothetical protein SNH27_11500 [Rikenellaceae bacterium]